MVKVPSSPVDKPDALPLTIMIAEAKGLLFTASKTFPVIVFCDNAISGKIMLKDITSFVI